MNKELDLLYDVSRIFISTLDLKQATNLILKKVKKVLNVTRTSLMLIDENDPRYIKIENAVGIKNDIINETRIKIGEDVSGYVVKTGKPLLVDNIEKDRRFSVKPWSTTYKTKSFLAVPLKIKDKIIGVINVNDKINGEKFTLLDKRLLTAIAAQAAIAIENAKLIKEVINKERDKEKLKSVFSSYLPSHIVEEIVKKGIDKMTSIRKVVTVLFVDIRRFSKTVEGLKPEEVINILNEFFTKMTDIILNHRGVVDKFLGDGILALFGIPISHMESNLSFSKNAILASFEMMKEFKHLLNRWEVRLNKKLNLGLGIGINTGEVIIGNIGSEKRLEYTVIGDNVTIASRLCDLARSNNILISESTYKEVKNEIVAQLREKKIKGKKEKYKVYEVKELLTEKQHKIFE